MLASSQVDESFSLQDEDSSLLILCESTLQTCEGHQEESIDDHLSDINSSSSVSLAEESSCSFESDNEMSSSIDIDDFLGPPTPVGCTHLLTYKLVGDNIDKNVRPRDMQSDHQTRSLHYFHTYAVCDRVDISHFSNETSILNVGTIQVDNLLPTNHDQQSLSL